MPDASKPSPVATQTARRSDSNYPAAFERAHPPPAIVYMRGGLLGALLERPCVAVVGSRKVTPYGKRITTQLAGELARAGVVIVSGLALGVDALAHRAALEAGGATIAVLPCGLDRVYPASHEGLARDIVAQGGILLSEYPPGTIPYPGNFVARNRLVAGLSAAVLITEAAEKSGTLHTARFALEQGKEVLAVPGNITSPASMGTNNLIKSGANVVTCATDIFHVLGIAPHRPAAPRGSNEPEQLILDLIGAGTTDGAELLRAAKLDIQTFDQTLTMLEISGKIRALGGNQWGM